MNGGKINWQVVFSKPPADWTEDEVNGLNIAVGTFGNTAETVRRLVNLWANFGVIQFMPMYSPDIDEKVSPSGKFYEGFFDDVYKERAFYCQSLEWGGDTIETAWKIVKEKLIDFGCIDRS